MKPLQTAWSRTRTVLSAFWHCLREVTEDSAYDSYVKSVRNQGIQTILPCDEFYRQRLEDKYSRCCRCC